MSSEDYFVRYLRQLGNVLAAILAYRKRKEYSLAIDEINQTLNSWFNLDSDDYELNMEAVNGILDNPSPNFENEKSIAELFYQKAETFREMGFLSLASDYAKLAVKLFDAIQNHNMEYSIEYQTKISTLKQMII